MTAISHESARLDRIIELLEELRAPVEWEYDVVQLGPRVKAMEALKKKGEEGWELVQIMHYGSLTFFDEPDPNLSGWNYAAFLRRPKPSPARRSAR